MKRLVNNGGDMQEKFLLIDGSSLIFRAFFAIRNLTTKDGVHTNGVYGFLNMYRRALEIIDPDYIVVAFDRSGPTLRNKDYAEYKGTRDKTPPELSHQFAMLKDVLDGLNVIHIDMDDYEADDILGTLARQAEDKGIQSYLLTGDRDYFQLVDENSHVLYTKKGITELEIYDIDKVFERYEISPKELIEVKGLMGDTSDNIPGVPGIGEKTAIKLIKEFGTIDQVYENLDQVSGKKLKENLENYQTQAFLSRKLGTIYTDIPMDYELEDFRKKEPNREDLYEKFKLLEMNTFMKDFAMDNRDEVETEDLIISDISKLDEFVNNAKKNKQFFFEIFNDNDDYTIDQIAYLGLFSQGKEGVLVLDFQEAKADIIPKIKSIFEDENIKKVSFDIKKAIYLFYKEGIFLEKNYVDMMLLAYLIDPSRSNYQMTDIASQYLEKEILSEEQLLGKGKSKKEFADIDTEELANYIANYIMTLYEAKDHLLKEIKDLQMTKLYEDIELPLINILAQMEITGVKVEKEALENIDRDISEELDRLEDKIYELAGEKFNINSPKQLGVILFDKLGLPVIKKTKTGYSTNAEVLAKLEDKHEIVPLVTRHRGLRKLKSTYIEGMYPYIMEDGRIHSIFRQTITSTGRLSSTEPNLQNIPIRTPEGRLIRKAFVADSDRTLISADYSQIELRVLAALSGDEVMLETFEQNLDIHKKTASEVFDTPLEEVSQLQRSDAKAVNFGIVYGISDYGLSQDLNISRQKAKEYIEGYLASYPQVANYMKQIVKDAKKDGYVETIFHRRRYVPELNSSNFAMRSFGERIALNTPIQGSAADIIKVAMVKVFNRLKSEGLKSRLILQVHDELIIETFNDEVDVVKSLLKEEMETAVKLDVDLVADLDIGDSWYDI